MMMIFLLFQVFEDLFTYMKSLDVILDLSPHVIHPGHGPVVTEAVGKVTEYIKHRNMREKQVRFMANNIQYIVKYIKIM